MSAPRAPTFMQGFDATTSDPLRLPTPSQARIRAVSWQSPAAATAVDDLPLAPRTTPPPAATPELEPLPSPTAPGFDALPPIPPPRPAPPPPPRSELSPKLESAIHLLQAESARLGEQARSDALEIGLMVARTILDKELTTSVDALFALIKVAIRKVSDARQITIKLCPDDASRVECSTEASLTLSHVKIVASPELSAGDVLVETEHHQVDARLSSRLAEVHAELSRALKEQA